MAAAVAMGAFGAHALRGKLDAGSLEIYRTAVQYHFFHALGILLVALLARSGAISLAAQARVGWLLLIGIIVFSGSLYALAVTGVRILGAITPIGGIAFIVGWVLLAYEATRTQS